MTTDDKAAVAVVLRCPTCQSEDVGSADVVQATAHGHWERKGDARAFVPEGYTEVHWDTQVVADDDEPCYCRNCDWAGKPEAMLGSDQPCIRRRFLGGEEVVTFEEFATRVVQDEDEATRIAQAMLHGAAPYPFNEPRTTGAEPEFYEEFTVADADDLARQVAE